MGITRDIVKVLPALDQERSIITCSTADQILKSTANVHAADVAVNGRVIDRLDIELGALYLSAEPTAWFYASRGSTEADRSLSLAVKLQHGDSSGGGDAADFFGPSTGTVGAKGVARNFFATARSTESQSWSTAGVFGFATPGVLDIHAAKRYVRAVVTPTKGLKTTESSGDEGFHLNAAIVFGAANVLAEKANTTGFGSTSTST